jgi:hypothetical protein
METNQQKQIAGEILRQLGGHMFILMTGASNFAYNLNDKGNVVLAFKIGNNSKGVNYVKIEYNGGSDLYCMSFVKSGINEQFECVQKVIASHDHVYWDMLVPIFEEETGMFTRLR